MNYDYRVIYKMIIDSEVKVSDIFRLLDKDHVWVKILLGKDTKWDRILRTTMW